MPQLEPDAKIYIEFGGGRMVIPVNPEEIEIKYPTDNKDYDVIGVGQVVVQRKPSLKEISWEGFFPAVTSDPYVNFGASSPQSYVDSLQAAMQSEQKGRLIITRSRLYDTNMRFIVSY